MSVGSLIDFGPQPPSNRFLRPGERELDLHRLEVGQCGHCALLQLVDPMPVDMVASRFDWLTYNEPERHLDDVVERLHAMLDDAAGSRILGLTYKDESTMARFRALGVARSAQLDLRPYSRTGTPETAIERLQEAVRVPVCRELARSAGLADLLMVRHVLEHAHEPRDFVRGLFELMAPGGRLVLEVPDCSKFVASGDACFFWEEHIVYFSEATLRRFVESCGATVEALWKYEFPMENSLIAVVRQTPEVHGQFQNRPGDSEQAAGRALAHATRRNAERYRETLTALRGQGKRICAFGAGHLAAKFINFNAVARYLDAVIDDSPHKQGLRMPGSALQIVGSEILERGGVDLCLLSLSPESEARVLEARQDYLDRGGEMRSMFSLSPRALLPAGAEVGSGEDG